MRSGKPGTPTSGVEVTNVSPHGVWLLLDDREVFLGFADFPWFAQATIQEIGQVERPSPQHLYWPALDVDLTVDSLEHPEAYPLISKARSDKRFQQPNARRTSRRTGARSSRLRS